MVLIASEIPIIILGFITALITILLSLGYIYRTSFPMSTFWFLSGAIFLIILLSVNSITYGETFLLDNIAETTNPNNQTLVYMNQTVGSTTTALNSGGNIFAGERVNNENSILQLKNMNCLDVNISKTGSPTGNMLIGVWSVNALPTAVNYNYLIDTVDVTTLNAGETKYSFCKTNGVYKTLQSGDIIGVFFNSGSAGNAINIFSSASDVFDSTNSVRITSTAGAFTTTTTSDLKGAIYGNGFDVVTQNNYEPNYHSIPIKDELTGEPTFIGIMLMIISLSFIMIGILIEKFN